MKVMSPEKCAELLEQHIEVIQSSTGKLQVILECFDEISVHGGGREFKDLSALSRGIVTICNEVINGLWNCDIVDIAGTIKLFSPDPSKVLDHVVYLKTIGINDKTPDIELENP